MNAFTILLSRTIASGVRGLVTALAIGALPVLSAQTSGPLQPANSILRRPVMLAGHGQVGDVDDLLLQMPSGRILFAAINPVELFRRPRVVDPAKLRPTRDGGFELALSYADWVSAPIVNWNGTTIEDYTRAGTRLVGTYDAGWPTPNGAVPPAVAYAPGLPRPAQFVSVRQLTSTPLMDARRRDFGYVASFLVDWREQRVNYAIASPALPPLPGLPVQRGIAVPLGLLAPQRSQILVRADANTFGQAPVLAANAEAAALNQPRVFRYDRNALLASVPAGARR